MVLGLAIQPGHRILDVGSGIGNPALQIAAAVGSTGTVIGLDPTPDMAAAARKRADLLRLSNVTFEVLSLASFQADGKVFDGVSASFSLMFIVDLDAALRHIRSLLKPGGRQVAAVWASMDENPMFRIPREALSLVVDSPKGSRDAPSPLRLSRRGELAERLAGAGFSDVRVEDVDFYSFATDAQAYFDGVYEMTPMFAQTFDALPDAKKDTARRALMDGVSAYDADGVIRVPARARVGIGVRGT